MSRRLSLSDLDISQCKSNYGQYMQTSSLADWVELQVLRGVSIPWKSMAETMQEANISGSLIDESYVDCGFVEEELGTNAAIDAESVYDETLPEGSDETVRRIIDYRIQYLGECYPFVFDNFNRLKVADGFPVESSAYITLLRLSLYMGWAYSQPGGKLLKDAITHLFEDIVGIALRNAGLKSAVLGTSQNGSFEEKLKHCCDELGLKTGIRTIEPPKNAKDEGVDVIGGFIWKDGRIGEPVWLIQATCSKNSRNRLEKKIKEPDPVKWESYLSTRANPVVFLAVPYHLTEKAIDNIVPYEGSKSFMDRLRLVKMIGGSLVFEVDKPLNQDREIKKKAHEFFGMPA